MIDDDCRRRKDIVTKRMVVVDLRIDEKTNGLIREFFYPSEKFLSVERGLTGVDDDGALLCKDGAAGRIPLLGGKDVNPIFDFGKSRP
jgi:hypothetical protein